MVITLTDPAGNDHDITSRCPPRSLGELTEEADDELVQLVHPDISFTLHDEDRFLRDLLAGAVRSDVYRLRIERQRWGGGGYDLVFAGVLDLVNGVSFDEKTDQASFQVLALSKLLELQDAGRVRRDVTGLTGSTTVGLKVVSAIPDTSALRSGDEITLDDGSNRETQVIDTVDFGTQVTCLKAFSSTFSAAELTLETPFYRGATVEALAIDLFGLAEISEVTVNISEALSNVPFPSSLNEQGLPASGAPAAMIERSSDLSIFISGGRYDAPSPSEAFSFAGGDTNKADWRPYKTTEPGTLRVKPAGYLETTVEDYDSGDDYDLQVSGPDLLLRKNAATIATVASGTGAHVAYRDTWIEYDEANDRVWVAYVEEQTFLGNTIAVASVEVYDDSGTAAFTASSQFGEMRCLAGDRMVVHRREPVVVSDQATKGSTQGFDVYAGSTLEVSLQSPGDGVQTETFRAMGDHYLAVRLSAGSASIAVWERATGNLVADHRFVGSVGGAVQATVFDEGGTVTPTFVCYAGGRYAVASQSFSGVIPYADFEGLSAWDALRELALVSGAYVWVDEFGAGYLVSRAASLSTLPTVEIDAPLRGTFRPVSAWYRASCVVTGETEDGEEVEEVFPPGGDSNNRLEISIDLPITAGLASALAAAYVSYFGSLGEQRDWTIVEPRSGRARFFGKVSHKGREYRVLRAGTSLTRATQSLELVAEGQ